MIISLLSLYLHVFFRAHPPPSLSSHFGSIFFLVIISCHNSPSIHPSVCPPPPCSLVPHPSLTFPLRSNERNVCVSLLQICQKSPLTQSNIHRARTAACCASPREASEDSLIIRSEPTRELFLAFLVDFLPQCVHIQVMTCLK